VWPSGWRESEARAALAADRERLAVAVEALGHPDPVDRLDTKWNEAIAFAARIIRERP
jgi:hypothetical protein